MKFHLAHADGYLITHVEPGAVQINGQTVNAPFLLFPDVGARAWGTALPTAQAHAAAAWQEVVNYAPNVVIIGTGEKHVMLHPSVLRPLIDARIGYEVMSTPAACRTYNVLLSEGRRVCAAIML
jgi:uncharacterized protein